MGAVTSPRRRPLYCQLQSSAAHRELGYLKGTTRLGLTFKKSGILNLSIYTDSDYSGSMVDRRSTTGYCTLLVGNLMTWRSVKQGVVSKDKKERVHAVEINLPQNYPNSAPSLAADVPYTCELHWQKGLRLKDAIQQFIEHLEKVQEFWSVLEEVDRSLCVLEPKQESHAASFRLICAGDGCQILLNIDAKNPRSKPECRFLGPNLQTETLWKSWKKNSRKWANDKPFIENLRTLMGVDLPGPPCPPTKDSEQDECGICYVHFLPSEITKEDGEPEAPTGGMAVDYKCENLSCRKSFHAICLRDWLKSITSTKQSFNVLFGKCPYCSEPVAVQLEAGG